MRIAVSIIFSFFFFCFCTQESHTIIKLSDPGNPISEIPLAFTSSDFGNQAHGEKIETTKIPGPYGNDNGARSSIRILPLLIYKPMECSMKSSSYLLRYGSKNRKSLLDILRV